MTRYKSLSVHQNCFRDTKAGEIQRGLARLAEAPIAVQSSKLDISKFQIGYEVAVKELVDAKLNHLPVQRMRSSSHGAVNVINLMDALRKSIGDDAAESRSKKKPVVSIKGDARKGIGLVKRAVKTLSKRRSALASNRRKAREL